MGVLGLIFSCVPEEMPQPGLALCRCGLGGTAREMVMLVL